MVLVTAGEAKAPRIDLPKAARYMYLLPVSFYIVAIFLLGLCINYVDPRLGHPHIDSNDGTHLDGLTTAKRSPFVIAVDNAGINVLPGF